MQINHSNIVLRQMKFLIECSLDKLTFVNVDQVDLVAGTPRPIITVAVTSGGLRNYSEPNIKPSRIWNITMIILGDEPKREIVTLENGKKGGESDYDKAYRLNLLREEFVTIFEQLLFFLTSNKFPFHYEIVGDVDYENVETNENGLCLYGKSMDMSISSIFCKRQGGLLFDEAKIKTFWESV